MFFVRPRILRCGKAHAKKPEGHDAQNLERGVEKMNLLSINDPTPGETGGKPIEGAHANPGSRSLVSFAEAHLGLAQAPSAAIPALAIWASWAD